MGRQVGQRKVGPLCFRGRHSWCLHWRPLCKIPKNYCTWAQEAISTKAQKNCWLVGGLKDHRYPSKKN